MFDDGNSWEVARDNAPRDISIFSSSDATTPTHLHVATGRPRALFVQYPAANGKTILCRGAVMSYYEFQSPTRLSDAEWLSEIQADKGMPALPEFTAEAFGVPGEPER